MFGNLIFLAFLSLLISINGQPDDRQLGQGKPFTGRASKASFDAQFSQGRCPRQFYQLGDECVYLSPDGKIYSWKQAENVCSRRIARMLKDRSVSTSDQPNMQPTKGVRQLILNTPEKTELLRAMSQEYDEQNFAVRLPFDYNILQRCHDGKDDKWPHYCTNPQNVNATCFETITHGTGTNDICLREVGCQARYLRLACEFTLPGSEELINSKFRNCPKVHGHHHRRLPIWAWIAIILAIAVLLLIISIVIFGLIRKKNAAGSQKKPLPEPRHTDEKVRVSSKPEDPAAEPMLVQPAPPNVSDTGYLEPRAISGDNTANA